MHWQIKLKVYAAFARPNFTLGYLDAEDKAKFDLLMARLGAINGVKTVGNEWIGAKIYAEREG